jgi:membrane associated rhomboid family serine protease
MFPIRDTVRTYSFPVVNWLIIIATAIVFLYEASLNNNAFNRFILNYGLVPARLNFTNPLDLILNPLALLTLVTHIFLHGSWFHFLSNIWTLFIFGDNVEDRLGPGRYLAFFLVSGVVAGLLQALVTNQSQMPAIGASGAIAGVLGAYFVLYPRSRVVTLILLIIIPWFVELPAILYLGIWFSTQLIAGVTTFSRTAAMGGVAWWAHIGGFLFGMFFHRFFKPPVHPAISRNYPDQYPPSA